MRGIGLLLLFAVLSAPALAADTLPGTDQPLLHAIAGDVRPDALQATVTRLVGFGTRHTLSDPNSKTRGIGAARAFVSAQFAQMSKACGGCLTIATPAETVTGPRIPNPTAVVDVLAIQPGTSDPNRVIVISTHVDSFILKDMLDTASDAPGADDDASGTAAVLEAARVLSQHKFPATLVYAVLSGEEQGLYGGTVLAHYARDQHWQVEASLNNDIVGNIRGDNGAVDADHVRVFSEGTRTLETQKQADDRRYLGGEVDSPSRNIARFIAGMADRYVSGLKVHMVYRTDRYGRGGDQVPMLAQGFPAVRFTEAAEDYTHEHQWVRMENGVQYGDLLAAINFPYLAQVARLNAVSMAALAMAPAPPTHVTVTGAVSWNTTLKWSKVANANGYRVWWRDTTAPLWSYSRDAGNNESLTLKDINIDDAFFGVSSVSPEGYDSPVVFPGDAGAFGP